MNIKVLILTQNALRAGAGFLNYFFFQDFAFWLKKWSNLEKSNFEILKAKNSKWKKKNQNCGFCKFFVLLKSVSKQKIMSIEQFLQEILNFKGENWTYF